MIEHPYYPVIYVRGYAGTQGAVEDTVATPYMGFNLGSTKYRQAYGKKQVEPWIFESPLVRLIKDHGYEDAYHDGQALPEGPVSPRSIWIFRYYDVTSKAFSSKFSKEGKRQEIEFHAERLSEFIKHVRRAITNRDNPGKNAKVYLVAHSMGGLICRCYLQNPRIPDQSDKTGKDAKNRCVDKLFTYATPHGGIEFRKGLGWAEGLRDFLDVNNSGNFGEKRMKQFLALRGKDLKSLGGRYDNDRVFSLVGTDSRDYGAAAGLSRRSVGPLSDGLVQMKNAYVTGSHRAYVHRSHSGHYGIVNSEEGYQSLQRFLFGHLKAALLLEKAKPTWPRKFDKKKTTVTHHVETVVSIRGIPVEVHRRTMSTGSSIFRNVGVLAARPTRLYTAFLDKKHASRGRRTIGFQVRMRVVPEYHVEKRLRRDDHFEGQAIFDDALVFLISLDNRAASKVAFSFSSEGEKSSPLALSEVGKGKNKTLVGRIPFKRPLLQGEFVVRVGAWNHWG